MGVLRAACVGKIGTLLGRSLKGASTGKKGTSEAIDLGGTQHPEDRSPRPT